MFCRQCGAEIRDGSQFCPKCGTQLASAAGRQGKAAVKVAPAKKFPFKLIGLLVAGIAAVALIAFVVVPLAGKLFGRSVATQEQPEAQALADDIETASEKNDESTADDVGKEGIALQLSEDGGFDYSKITIEEGGHKDYPINDYTQDSVYKWTVTNTSDEVCPAVKLCATWDVTRPKDLKYRDVEMETHRAAGSFNGMGLGFVDGFLYELQPGESRNLYLRLSTISFAGEKDGVIYHESWDNPSVETDEEASRDEAARIQSDRSKFMPAEWNADKLTVKQEIINGFLTDVRRDHITLSVTNTTDYRIRRAWISYSAVDSEGWLIERQDAKLIENLEPGETRTIETDVHIPHVQTHEHLSSSGFYDYTEYNYLDLYDIVSYEVNYVSVEEYE